MVILRLEEYFPKCGKHTIEGGYQERFYTVQRYDTKSHSNSANTFPFSTLI